MTYEVQVSKHCLVSTKRDISDSEKYYTKLEKQVDKTAARNMVLSLIPKFEQIRVHRILVNQLWCSERK